MNPDYAISSFLNSFVGRSPALDEILTRLLSGTSMFSSATYLSVVWFLWFKNSDVRDRVRLLIGVATAVAAALLSRAIQFSLPFHARPLYNAALHLKLARGVLPGTLSGWSSFPSDHATICFGLATATLCHHRKLGSLMFAWDDGALRLPGSAWLPLHDGHLGRCCAGANCGCSLSADSGDRESIRPAVTNLGTTSGSVLLDSVFNEL